MARAEEFSGARATTGLSIRYNEDDGGSATVALLAEAPLLERPFTPLHLDEARILFMQASEVLESRAEKNESPATIRAVLEKLFALYALVA